jgi:hypothetical protein
MTTREMIRDAMQEIGALAAGEPVTNADAQVGLTRLNSMLDLWQTERLTIYNLNRILFDFVAGQASYTIGPTSTDPVVTPDIDYPVRPTYIQTINIRVATDDYPFEMPIRILTDDEWAELAIKSLDSTYPTRAYYNPTIPLGTLSFWPIPLDTSINAALYIPAPLGHVDTLSTELTLAPGYAEAIRYNLALRLCAPFGRPADAAVIQLATESKAQIKRTNTFRADLKVDPALRQSGPQWSIFTGGFG